MFDNLTNLTTLELWGNDLKALAPGLFRNLTSLVELSLHNGIFDVDILRWTTVTSPTPLTS